jgi:hypothetical protein
MQFFRHVWNSRPSFFETAETALIWGAVVPFCMLADYFLWRHMAPPSASRVAIIFGLGAAFAAPVAFWLAKIIGQKNINSAFAATFVLLSIGTLGLTALIFAFDFWLYFSQWHGEVFSGLWTNQFVFTFASAIYQFLVSGLRLYLPFGLIALVLASMWASRRITR